MSTTNSEVYYSTSGMDLFFDCCHSLGKDLSKSLTDKDFSKDELDLFDSYDEIVCRLWDLENLYENLIAVRSGKLVDIYSDDKGVKHENVTELDGVHKYYFLVRKDYARLESVRDVYGTQPGFYKHINGPFGLIEAYYSVSEIAFGLRKKRFFQDKIEKNWNSAEGINKRAWGLRNFILSTAYDWGKDKAKKEDKEENGLDRIFLFYEDEILGVLGHERFESWNKKKFLSDEEILRMISELKFVRVSLDDGIYLVRECLREIRKEVDSLKDRIFELSEKWVLGEDCKN